MSQNSLRLVEDKSVDKSKALEAALSQIERAFGCQAGTWRATKSSCAWVWAMRSVATYDPWPASKR